MRGATAVADWLNLLYKATAIANIADNAATSPLTNLQVGLHATWPGASGNQTTGEVAYTNYARVAVARGAGFTVTGQQVSPAAQISFPACGATGATANFWSVGTAASGTGKLLDFGAIGAAPKLITGATSDTITAPAHGLAVNDPVVFWGVFQNGLPTGITEGTVYYCLTAPTADTFTISATVGGSTLDITGIGAAAVQKLTPHVIVNGYTPILGTGTVIRHE